MLYALINCIINIFMIYLLAYASFLEAHNMEEFTFGKLAAIITQSGHCYYDNALNEYGIGWGQQFLLLRIYENQGTSILKLAKKSILDQSTTTRALQKLHKQGYIRFNIGADDRRIRKVFTTTKALPVINATLLLQKQWNEILVKDMSDTEIENAYKLLYLMAKNAYLNMHVKNDEFDTAGDVTNDIQ